MSIIADAGEDADGVMDSVLAYGRYPDCPRSEPPLAAEGNLNPECAEEGLYPAQSASEAAGTFGPARPVRANLQKIGCAPRPLLSLSAMTSRTSAATESASMIFSIASDRNSLGI